MSVSTALDIAVEESAADDGGVAALQRIFRRCGVGLYRYIRVRTGDDHTADDLMQQLWLSARRGVADVPEERIEFALRAIATNLVRTLWRQRKCRPPHVPIADPRLAAELAERLAHDDLPAAELERSELHDQLLLALTELPAADQELIIGYHFQDRSYADLAERLSLSVRAVEGRLYRARALLREKLSALE
jgi:RNA polymerase sigma-70 factor (ECF subfamily)